MPEKNTLLSMYPEIAKEWHPTKNGVLLPSDVAAFSNKNAWWLCSRCGGEWEAKVSWRTTGNGCPFCSGRKVKAGFNDLATKHPEVAKEWHPTKNKDLKPTDVTAHSNRKAWWLCSNCGYEWEATVDHRSNGRGCPKCSKRRASQKLTQKNLIPGVNDLETLFPEIASEWDFDKNQDSPKDYSPYSMRKKWWRCGVGHSFEQVIANRTSQGQGCPICAKEYKSSFPEQAILFYINRSFPDSINSDKSTIGMELDVFIPSKKVAVEYDGAYWHKDNEENDVKKNELCLQHQISLIRVREKGLSQFDNCITIVRDNKYSDADLENVIRKVLYLIDPDVIPDVDLVRDRTLVYNSYSTHVRKNNLAVLNPELAAEWHPTMNGDRTPEMVTPNSHKKAWWICKEGHTWEAVIKNRNLNGTGCPICSQQNRKLNTKEVMCLETREVFASINEAGKKYGVDPAWISDHLHGGQKTVKGLHWAFVIDGKVDPNEELIDQISFFDE